MQKQPQALRQEALAFLLHFVQPLLVVVEEHEIVDVADIALDAQFFFHEVVERREVEVGEELAGEVAHRQAFAAGGNGEQVVAGEIIGDRLLRVGVVDDQVDKGEGAGAFDLAGGIFSLCLPQTLKGAKGENA